MDTSTDAQTFLLSPLPRCIDALSLSEESYNSASLPGAKSTYPYRTTTGWMKGASSSSPQRQQQLHCNNTRIIHLTALTSHRKDHITRILNQLYFPRPSEQPYLHTQRTPTTSSTAPTADRWPRNLADRQTAAASAVMTISPIM